MCRSKILSFLVTVSTFVFSTSTLATVHNFGNLQPSSPKYVAFNPASNVRPVKYSNDLFYNRIALEAGNLAHNNKGYGTARERAVDFIGIYLEQNGHNTHFDNLPLVTTDTAAGDTAATEYHDSPTTPVTPTVTTVTAPVPEPETYTLILAGLALIGLTVRHHRNRDS